MQDSLILQYVHDRAACHYDLMLSSRLHYGEALSCVSDCYVSSGLAGILFGVIRCRHLAVLYSLVLFQHLGVLAEPRLQYFLAREMAAQ